MKRKMGREEFKHRIKALVDNEYSIIGEYIDLKHKILIRHNSCNYEWNCIPNNFLNLGARCPKCNGKYRRTHKDFVKELFELVGNEYELLNVYTRMKNKVLLRHNKCGHEYYTMPQTFINCGSRCPKCEIESRSKTHNEFIEEIKMIHNDEYELLTKYKTNKDKVLVRHTVCRYQWEVVPFSLLRGSGCPKCNGGVTKTHEQFIKDIYTLYGDKITIISEYTHKRKPIQIIHTTCGEKSTVLPSTLIDDKGEFKKFKCRHCASKNRERYKYIKSNTIKPLFKKDTNDLTEFDLETILVNDLQLIEDGMTFIKRQKRIDEGRIDILTRDIANKLCIIELKIVEDCRDLIFQCAYYPTQFDEDVRMITITPGYTERIFKALKNIGSVEMKQYRFKNGHLTISNIN